MILITKLKIKKEVGLVNYERIYKSVLFLA